MTNETFLELAARFSTPCFVFDTGALAERMRGIRAITGDSCGLCYSIKANPFLIPAMLELTDAVEVCSPGELSLCESYGVPAEKILYSGVCKGREDTERAIRMGVSMFTAESVNQALLLQEAAEKAGKRIPVLLRLNSGAQFGMSLEDLEGILGDGERFSNLSVEGIHYFAGTQRKNRGFAWQKKELAMLTDLLRRLRTTCGLPLPKLEYGPGLPVPLFAGDDFSDTLAPLREIREDLAAAAECCSLTLEAGRFFAAPCGYYLTGVSDVKTVPGAGGETTYVLADGGINHVTYPGSVMGMKTPVVRHLRPGEGEAAGTARPCKICGSLCTTGDELVRETTLCDPRPGDLFVFENLGAYSVSEGIYLFLCRTMPGIVIYNSALDARLERDFTETYPLFAGRAGSGSPSGA